MDKQLIRAWLLTVFVVTVPFWGILAGTETAIFEDLIAYHLPTMSWVADQLGQGSLPEWGQWAFAGQNVIGIGQGAVFYPFTMLFGLFGPVLGYRIWLIAHLWIATTGAFVWSWRTWHSRTAALISGIGYGLNGFFVLHLIHMNFIIGSAWMPWMLVGVDLVHTRWSSRRAAALALPLAMIAVGGHPQILWLALLTGCVYSLALLTQGDIPWRTRLRTAGRVAAAGALGLGLAAISIVPQYLFSRTSVRSAHTMETAFDLAPSRSHQLTTVFPHLMGGASDLPGVDEEWRAGAGHETATHTGIVVAALAAFGAFATWRSRRTIGLAVVALYAATTAVGSGTPIGPLAFRLVPMAGAFRAWGRNMVMFNLSASLLAGAGVVALLRATDRHRRTMAVTTAGVVLALLGVASFDNFEGERLPLGHLLSAVAVPLSCTAVAIAAVLVIGRYPRQALAAIAAACAINMVFFAYGAPWRSKGMQPAAAEAYFDHGLPHTGIPYDAGGGIDRWVGVDLELRGLAIINDTSSVLGYDPLIQRNWADVTGMVFYGGFTDRFWAGGWFADVLRVTTAFLPADARPDGSWLRAGIMSDTGQVMFTRHPRLAEAYVVGTVQVESDLTRIASRLSDPGEDFTRMVLLDQPSDTLARVDNPGVVAVVKGSMADDGSGRFSVTSDGAGVLVISSPWLDGWEATVNGSTVKVERANGLVLAIPISEGTNDVRLEFHSPGLAAGALISGLSALILVGLGAIGFQRRRATSGPVGDGGNDVAADPAPEKAEEGASAVG